MFKKLQEWMDEVDQKKMDMLHLSDIVNLPIDKYESPRGENFQFLIANKDHVDDIIDLEKAAYGEDKIPWQQQSVWKDIVYNPKSLYIMAYDQAGQAAAFLSSWLVEEDAHITNICVHPSYQRQGLARFLMDILKEIALELDINYLSLEVRRSNEGAQQLYVRYGFKPTTVIEDYYQDKQEDAIRMVKRIRPKLDPPYED